MCSNDVTVTVNFMILLFILILVNFRILCVNFIPGLFVVAHTFACSGDFGMFIIIFPIYWIFNY